MKSNGAIWFSLNFRVEIFLGKACLCNEKWKCVCVSKSMKNWIVKNFKAGNEQVDVLYDRPNEKYSIFSDRERQTVNIIDIFILMIKG